MLLEMGMSTRRYFPAKGTAGLARSRVRGNRRLPWPPPRMMVRTRAGSALARVVADMAASSVPRAGQEAGEPLHGGLQDGPLRGIADAHGSFPSGAERHPRRNPDPGFVEELPAEGERVGQAGDTREHVEGPVGRRDRHAR